MSIYIFLTHFLLFHLYYGLGYLLLFIYFSFGFSLFIFSHWFDLLCANCSSFFLVDLPSSLSLYCPLSSFFYILLLLLLLSLLWSSSRHTIILCITSSSISKRRRTRQKNIYICMKKENKINLNWFFWYIE